MMYKMVAYNFTDQLGDPIPLPGEYPTLDEAVQSFLSIPGIKKGMLRPGVPIKGIVITSDQEHEAVYIYNPDLPMQWRLVSAPPDWEKTYSNWAKVSNALWIPIQVVEAVL